MAECFVFEGAEWGIAVGGCEEFPELHGVAFQRSMNEPRLGKCFAIVFKRPPARPWSSTVENCFWSAFRRIL